MEYVRDRVEILRMQAVKLYEMFYPTEVYHDAVAHPIGFVEYFGPSPVDDAPRVDPCNWDLYWVSDGPLDELPPQPELQHFPKGDQPQSSLDILAKEDRPNSSIRVMPTIRDEPEPESTKDATPEAPEDQSETSAKDGSDAAAEDLRSSLETRNLEVEAVAEDYLKASNRVTPIIQDEPEPKKDATPEAPEDQSETSAKDESDAAAEDLRNSIANLETRTLEVEVVAEDYPKASNRVTPIIQDEPEPKKDTGPEAPEDQSETSAEDESDAAAEDLRNAIVNLKPSILEVEATKEDHLKSSIRVTPIIQDEPEPKKDATTVAPEDLSQTIAKDEPDAAAEDLRNSIANLKTRTLDVEAVAESPIPHESPSFLTSLRAFLTTRPAIKFLSIKLPQLKLKLPEVKLGTVTAPQPVPETVPFVAKKHEPLHYSRTPLATYARVRSRLQDRPPLVAAFADQVSVLNPAALVPKQESEDKPVHTSSAWDRLMHNFGYLLPTPVAALVHTHKHPHKRSLLSILGGRAARKVFAEVEHDPLDDSMIPQYRKWKRIKNKKLHNAQWACLIIACILLICAVQIERLREIKWWKFEFWQWLALGFVAFAGRLISGWGIKLLEISIECNLLLKKRILYFVFGLRRSLKNIMWLGLILTTWTVVVLHVEDVSNTIPTITKLLQCGFTGSILWVLKVLLVKILTSAFHRNEYFDRIQDSLFHQYVLEILSEPRSHRYARSIGKGADSRRRTHAPVFKLRLAPSQKLARKEAKTQGRIERQYSPTPSTFRVEKLESRSPPRALYSKTTLNPFVAGKNSWANFKLPSFFPTSIRSSPKVLPTANAGALISSGTPSSMKGGLDPVDPLQIKSSLTIPSRVDSHSQLKVRFQDSVVEEQNPNQEVVAAVEAVKDMEAVAVVEVEKVLEAMEAVEDTEAVAVVEVEKILEAVEDVQASSPLAGNISVFSVPLEKLKSETVPGVELVIPEPEITSQAEEVIQPGLILQEKELQAEMDVPKVLAETGLAPEPQVVATEAVPEPMSSAGPSEPVAAAPTKPPIFLEVDIEVEDGSGHETHTTLAQDKIQILTKDSVSAWTLMRLMKVVRTRNLHMYSKSSLMEPDWEIDSIPMATKAAKYIFKNVAHKGQQELLLKNFMRFFPPNKATQAFSTFEVTLNGTITKQGLLKWVLDVYKERKALSLTLNDNRSVIESINLLLDGVLIAVILAISFLIMSVDNQALLAVTTMLLAPAVSIFGNLLRNTFESLLFLFIVHPFDVGDRVFIEGVPLMVEEMKIMSTVFLNNASEHITYPNFVLMNKPIANIHRSPDQWDAIEFQILANTSLEKLSILRNRIDQYVQALPQIWYPRWRLIVRDIENTNKLRLLMTIQHHINFQDAGERTQRRGDMLLHIQGLMLDLAIEYQLPPGHCIHTQVPT